MKEILLTTVTKRAITNRKMAKYIDDGELRVWGFMDKETGMVYPPDVCPLCPNRSEAWAEKRKHPVYYSNTKVVRLVVTEDLK